MNVSDTRREILGEIKKAGEISIPELTKKLNIVTNAVRGHMMLLEKEALVTYKWLRQKRGRPLKIYRLSETAEAYFPKRYDDLLIEIIEQIVTTEGAQRLTKVLASLSKKKADGIKERVNFAILSREEVLNCYVDYLNKEGYLSILKKSDGGYNILNYNCIYRNVARKYREICNICPEILRELTDLRVELTTTIFDESPCCKLYVAPQ
ncbi:MAG: winged helix-turn-helix transcriptional regulator [Thermodesulfovibrionales bacterium]|nr:winged helix-turn-helix transcriptional regulator [Thermodesulfovibrionales bacterium]